jgi:pyruvate formate lyase activating enzyme
MITRRDFLIATARYTPAMGFLLGSSPAAPSAGLSSGARDRAADLLKNAPRANYWVSTADHKADCLSCHTGGQEVHGQTYDHKRVIVKCLLCAQGCVIPDGQRGRCRARMNVNGELRSLVYGRPVTFQVDPIEKKPFYHFLPGSDAFSLATAGCPLSCKFCQNWQISQSKPEDFDTKFVPPADVVAEAVGRSSPVIAFTYNEPTVFTEYLTDIARVARRRKLRSVLVSCGFMNPGPLTEMCDVLDAIKIDLKGFDEEFYRKICQAELQPVLRSLKQISQSRVHLEIVNLVVPTLNDSEKMMRALVEWVMGELGPDVPIHFTRFHPDFQLLNLPPTPVATLENAREIARSRGVRYAYVGNVPGHPGNQTYCPKCGRIVVKRNSFLLEEMNIKGGKCKFCGTPIAGVWS